MKKNFYLDEARVFIKIKKNVHLDEKLFSSR